LRWSDEEGPQAEEEEVNTTKCNKCGAEIVFAKTRNDKWLPLDAEVTEHGDFWVDEKQSPPRAGKVYPNTPDEHQRYKCHFDTCTERKQLEDDDLPF